MATYQPDELTRRHPLHETLAAMADAARPPERLLLEPLRRDELARLIEGIEGERPSASVLLLVSERSRGNALIAEELLAARRELAGASLTRSLDELVIARLASRSTECRRVLRLLAPAGEPLTLEQLSTASLAFEREADRQLRARARRRAAAAASWRPTSATGWPTPWSTAFAQLEGPDGDAAVDDAAVSTLPADAIVGDSPSAHRPGDRGRPAARPAPPPPRGAGRGPRRAARIAGPALAGGPPARPARAAAIEAATQAERVDSLADALAHLELALEIDDRTEPPGGSTDPASPVNLLQRAAEAAFADNRAAHAAAYAESAIARLDERSDRLRMGLIYERLGRYRRSAGDQDGAIFALTRAVELVPAGAVPRARPGPRGAGPGAGCSRARSPRPSGSPRRPSRLPGPSVPTPAARKATRIVHPGHQPGVGRGPRGRRRAPPRRPDDRHGAGQFDEVFRATANLTTALDLLGRKREAVEVAQAGIEAAHRAGQEAVFGNFLRGNGADSLFLLGDWAASAGARRDGPRVEPGRDQPRQRALEPGDRRDRDARRRSGRTGPRPAAARARDGARRPGIGADVPGRLVLRPVAGRPRGRPARRRPGLEPGSRDRGLGPRRRGWPPSSSRSMRHPWRTPGAGRDLSTIAAARTRSGEVLAEAEGVVEDAGVDPSIGSRREADAHLAVARAYRARIDGRDEPAAWEALARTWEALERPYQVARARWRQAEAALGAGDGRAGRTAARAPLLEAVRVARELGAGPLLRELEELARRALIPLPDSADGAVAIEVGARSRASEPVLVPVGARPGSDRAFEAGLDWASGASMAAGEERLGLASAFVGPAAPPPGDTFGLSRREREVLVQLAQGADEPGDRRTAVHQPEDGRRPCREHPGQAGCLGSRRGCRRGDPAGPHRDALSPNRNRVAPGSASSARGRRGLRSTQCRGLSRLIPILSGGAR